MRWTNLDRALALSGMLLGVLAFGLAVWGSSDPRRPHPAWALPIGIACLLAGLSFASLMLWRGRSD